MAGSTLTIKVRSITAGLERGFKRSGDASQKLSGDLRKTARASLDVRDATLKVEAAERRAAAAARRWGEDSHQAARANLQVERSQQRLSREIANATGQHARLASAEAATDAARKKSLGTIRSVAGSMAVATRRAIGLATAVAGISLGAAVGSAVSFEQQMSRVQAKLLVSRGEMAGLNRLAVRLGAETSFSATESAQAMEELAAAGLDANKIYKVLPGTMALAAASGADLAQAAEIQTSTLAGFGLQMRDATRVADVLSQTANASAADITTMQEAIKYVAPVARASGQELESMMAAIGLMANVGIQGSQAGTTLRTALIRLQAPTRRVHEALGDMGLRISDLQGPRGLRPMPEIIGKMVAGSERLDKATRNGAIASIFGAEALSGMVALVERGEGSYRRMQRSLEDSTGAADRAQRIMRNNVAGAWDQVTGAIESSSIALTGRFMPDLQQALRDGADDIDRWTVSAGDFIDGLLGNRAGIGEATSGAREFGLAVRDVAEAGADVSLAIGEVVVGVTEFVAGTPGVRDLVGVLLAAGAAAKAIKFVSAVTGINQLVAGARRLRQADIAASTAAAAPGRGGVAPAAAAAADRRAQLGTAAGLGIAAGGTALGGMVGGTTGTALGGAAAGAGIGMIAGPWGAAGGALIGAATSGLVGAVRGHAADERRERAAAEARKWAEAFTGAVADGVGRGMDPRTARQLARAQLDAERSPAGRRADAARYSTRSLNAGGSAMFGVPAGMRVTTGTFTRDDIARAIEGKDSPYRISERDLAQIRSDAERVGEKFRAALGGKFTTGRFLLEDFRRTYARLDPVMQQLGANAVVRYARGLEQSGRLARGSTDRLIKGIAREFDGLTPRVAGAGARSRRALEQQLLDDGIIRRANRLVDRLAGPDGFAALPRVTARSVQGATATIRTHLDQLDAIARDKNAPKLMREQAASELPRLRRRYDEALGRLTATFGGSRQAADRWARGVSASARRVEGRREQVRALVVAVDELTRRLRDGRSNAELLAAKFDVLRGSLAGVVDLSRQMPDFDALANAPRLTSTPPRRRRRGGRIPRFNQGGMVPAWVSSGEEIVEPGGRSWIVPGLRVAADNVFTYLPVDSKVFTDHGQALRYDLGLSDEEALARQAPHFARGGVVRGRVSYFGPPGDAVGGMASGQPSSVPGLALNLNPGTDSGWNNPTTQGWIARARKGDPVNFLVQIGSKRGVLPLLDLGPAGWTHRAIDVTGAGARRMGIDPEAFPTNEIGTATMVGRGEIPLGTPGARGYSYSYMKAPAVTRSRRVDLLQPYGALDAFQQGLDAGAAGNKRLFRTWRGLDTDLFASAISGVRANERDRPKRITVDVPGVRGRGGRRGSIAAGGGWGGSENIIRSLISGLTGGQSVSYKRPADHPLSIKNPGSDHNMANTNAFAADIAPGSDSIFNAIARRAGISAVRGSWNRFANRPVPGFQTQLLWYAPDGSHRDHVHAGAHRMRRGGIAGRRPCASCGGTHPGMRCGGRIRSFRGGGEAIGQVVGRPIAVPRRGGHRLRETPSRVAQQLSVSVGRAGAGPADIVDELRQLGQLLDDTNAITYRRLEQLRRGVHAEIVGLMRGGETGAERVQIRRLRGALTLLEAEMGHRVGLSVGRATRAVEQVDVRQGRVTNMIALQGRSDAEPWALEQQQKADRESRRDLGRQLTSLQRQLARARRLRETDAVNQIREQIDTVTETMTGLAVGIATRGREIAATRFGAATARINASFENLTGATDQLSISQRIRGVSPDSLPGMREQLGTAVDQRAQIGNVLIPQAIHQLREAFKAGSLEGVENAAGLLRSLQDALPGLDATIAELNRSVARAARYQPNDLADAWAATTSTLVDDIASAADRQRKLHEDLAAAQAAGDDGTVIELLGLIRSTSEALAQAARALRYQDDDLALALAGLTETTDDDRAAYESRERKLREDLDRALAADDKAEATQLANELKSTQDALRSLAASIEASQQQLADLIRQQIENQRTLIALAQSEPGALAGILAAMLAGEIGGPALLGSQTPGSPGKVAAY